MQIWLRSLCTWLLLVTIVVLCGFLRILLLQPLVGEVSARWLATAGACCLLALSGWLMLRRVNISRKVAFGMGVVWARLSVGVEFLFYQFVLGYPWDFFLMEYNVFALRPWPLVPATIFAVPLMMAGRRTEEELRFPD